MMVGMAISTDGDFQDEEQFINFGKLFKKTFAKAVDTAESPAADNIILRSDGKTKLNYFVISEDISKGENADSLKLFADGKEIYAGECIGHKRIVPLNGITAKEIKAEVKSSENEELFIKKAELY